MTVFVVMEEEPASDYPSVIESIYSTSELAEAAVKRLEDESEKPRTDLWWEIETHTIICARLAS
jgi:hypothetical protein